MLKHGKDSTDAQTKPMLLVVVVNQPQQILDIETYIAYLSVANANPAQSPEYFMLYNTREEYGWDNLFPDRFDLLARQLASIDSLWDRFYE